VLPDGIFSKQKSLFGKFFEGLAMEDVSIFYGHLVYFTYCHLVYFVAIWYSLKLFGIFFPFLVFYTKKKLAALNKTTKREALRAILNFTPGTQG
jgi:hypothetical protein